MTACTPSGVSRRDTLNRSPEFMNRSFCGSGVNVARVDSTGLGGAVGRPFLVTNAKLTYSRPVRAAHVGFRVVPLTGSSARLEMVIAAHHFVASQRPAPTATGQVGHGIHPGGKNCSSRIAVPGWTARSTMLESLSGVQVETCSG